MKKTGPRQLSLVFADSPSGGGSSEPSDASERRSFLLHKARTKKTSRFRRQRGRHQSAARRSGVRSQSGQGAAERSTQQGSAGSGRTDGRGGGGESPVDHRPFAPRLAGRNATARRCPPGLAAEARGRATWAWHSEHFGPDGAAGGSSGHWSRSSNRPSIPAVTVSGQNAGAHTAIAEATGYLKDGYQTVVDLDLAKFFDRVHHQRLLARIAERVKDQRIITLVRLMLTASVVMPDGTKVAVKEGTPQGGPLSPMLSNVVLNELDGELARRGLRFVRYADDCNIFVRSERAGQRVMASIRRFLENAHAAPGQRGEEWRSQTGGGPLSGLSLSAARRRVRATMSPSFLRARAERRLMTTMREMTPPNWGRSISSCMEDISRYLTGWISYFRLCTPDAVKGLGVIDAHVRRRIRAIIVRQKKRQRFLFRHLKAKGVSSKAAAGCAYLRQRSMGEIEPPGDDEGLSTVLVRRADGLAQSLVERSQPVAGIGPAIAGVLTYRSKEPDAGPHVRFCERRGGAIPAPTRPFRRHRRPRLNSPTGHAVGRSRPPTSLGSFARSMRRGRAALARSCGARGSIPRC